MARSICPYCGVGCGQVVYHKEGKLVAIEGDPASPVSRVHLCPKGADTLELHTHSNRLTKVRYHRPYSRNWEDLDLETAMDMIADRVWDTRERTFQETRDRESLMQTTAIAHLGGAIWMLKKTTSSASCSGRVWGWCASAIRREYDTVPRCPVWALRLDVAEPLLHSRI
jgi:anaerobic selenocysteine-containing dehydrogenase